MQSFLLSLIITSPITFYTEMFLPFRRFLFIFLIKSLSSIVPSSYGLFKPRPKGVETQRKAQSPATRDVYIKMNFCATQTQEGRKQMIHKIEHKLDGLTDKINRADRETSRRPNNEDM